jgi:hypothetical protein
MSQGLMAYLVSNGAFECVGCKDKSLRDEVLEVMADDIEMLDEDFDTENEEFGPGLTFTQAVKELFAGKFSQPEDCDFMYVYAFELVCRCFGEMLENEWFSPCKIELLSELDRILAKEKVPLRFEKDLLCRPEKLPNSGDVLVGYWTHREIIRAKPLLEALLEGPPIETDLEQEGVQKALETVQNWLNFAAENPERIIVAFFY